MVQAFLWFWFAVSVIGLVIVSLEDSKESQGLAVIVVLWPFFLLVAALVIVARALLLIFGGTGGKSKTGKPV